MKYNVIVVIILYGLSYDVRRPFQNERFGRLLHGGMKEARKGKFFRSGKIDKTGGPLNVTYIHTQVYITDGVMEGDAIRPD